MNKKIWPATHCPLTGKSGNEIIKELISFEQGFESEGVYWLYKNTGKDQLLIVTDELFNNSDIWTSNKREVEYLLYNNRWPRGMKMVDTNFLLALIRSSNIPNSPIDKLRELIFYFKSVSNFFGGKLYVKDNFEYKEQLIKKNGMANSEELEKIIFTCIELGYVKDEGSTKEAFPVSLTLKGWEETEKLNLQKTSNISFVAMSFDPAMMEVYSDWIEPAIRECGFEPYIVSDQHPDSDVTINDAILAGIKKARFTIADFTNHKAGVYFEAGYALGSGQKVIYTCREDHIESAHFDTRNYQHLVWKDNEEFKRKLMDKIEVFIKN